MKKINLLCITALAVFALLISCKGFSGNAAKEGVVKDSLQSFFNGVSNSSKEAPLLIVNSVTITKARDTMDTETFGHPELFSHVTWNAEITVKKDMDVQQVNNFSRSSFSLGNVHDFFFKKLDKLKYIAGDKINLTGMHTFLIGNESGGHLVCYFLFDDEHLSEY